MVSTRFCGALLAWTVFATFAGPSAPHPVAERSLVKLPLKQNDCPSGYAHIVDMDVCMAALSILGYPYKNDYQITGRTDRPTGCIWHANGRGYFNPSGRKGYFDQAPICQKTIPSPTQPPTMETTPSPTPPMELSKVPLGHNECPSGFEHIVDMDVCMAALSILGYPYKNDYQIAGRTDRPTGCIWHTNGRGYFNPSGLKGYFDQAPICHTVPAAAPPTPSPPLPCKDSCSSNEKDWVTKCNWSNCQGCSDCASVGRCKPRCAMKTPDWTTKCGWAGCHGCSDCP